MSQGTKLAVGIILLWFGGFCLFVAFMSGKIAGLTTSSGQGPSNVTELTQSLAASIQQHETTGTG